MKKMILGLVLMMTSSAFAGDLMDRQLTKKELEKLAPIYAEFIMKRAETVVSPADNEILHFVASHAEGWTTGLFTDKGRIGTQVGTIQETIDSLESLVKRLKELPTADRVASVKEVVSGLADIKAAGKLKCTLGYLGSYKDEAARIVKCVDDRSVQGTGDDDEGYGDVRTIILNIDPKTLLPQSVLKLEHMMAG